MLNKSIAGLKLALQQKDSAVDDKDADDSGKTITLPMHEFYATADQGPFRCDHCSHYSAGKCDNEYVIEHHGASVGPSDCCDLYHSKES